MAVVNVFQSCVRSDSVDVMWPAVTANNVQLVNAPPASTKELKELRELQAVARSQRLRGMAR
jgi:hypothetical protein